MSNLSQEQLKLMDLMNKTRLAVVEEFRKSPHPDPAQLYGYLLKLQVALMENQHREDVRSMIDQNQQNISVLSNMLMVRPQPQTSKHKFNLKWSKPVEKEEKPAKNQPNPEVNKISFKAPRDPRDAPTIAKMISVPPGEFMSAGTLPKGTSVRKKFVPPYKKPENPLKEVDEKDEDEQGSGEFAHLEKKLVQVILSEILEKKEEIDWKSIAGLGFAKKTIHEMIVWPMLRPDIFTGLRAPPKAILLFGPPGTGKTMIGRAIASQASATFFSISASSLTSKWVGESQKLVKTLFAIARAKQPSVIFIDEIDSLLSARSEGEQQSSRRIKTEFLVELDGAKTTGNERVLCIGATNLPQELDDAVRRRFVKRLYIPLPNLEGRKELLTRLTDEPGFRMGQEHIEQVARMTRGFSGADLYTLCSQTAMMPLREMTGIEDVRKSDVPVAQLRHFVQALQLVRPSVNQSMLSSYQAFNEQYGSYQITPDDLEAPTETRQ